MGSRTEAKRNREFHFHYLTGWGDGGSDKRVLESAIGALYILCPFIDATSQASVSVSQMLTPVLAWTSSCLELIDAYFDAERYESRNFAPEW